MKAQYVIDLLKSNSNRFTPAQLESATGSPRRARRALFLARKAGLALEAIRDSGRAVTAYVANGAIPTVAAAVPARKASKSAAVRKPKAEPAVKVVKSVKTATARKPKTDKVVKIKSVVAEDNERIKAANLATIKAVHAKVNQKVHPITARPMTDEEADVLDEFRAMEAEYEAEQERLAARAAVRENLPKEAYSE
jgi:hypothetical protein